MFTIHIDLISFLNNKNVTGTIYLEQNNYFYPEERWNDFAVIISSWWTGEFYQFLKKKKKSCRFVFMDGHYNMILERNGNSVILFFLDTQDNVIKESLEPIETILRALITSGEKIIAVSKSNEWESRDLDKLQANVNKLKMMESSKTPHC